MKRVILRRALGLLTFLSGYAVLTVYPCRRIQAQCSYRVTRTYCMYNGCDSCDQFGMPCCYEESGPCDGDPYHDGYSEICFGTCLG